MSKSRSPKLHTETAGRHPFSLRSAIGVSIVINPPGGLLRSGRGLNEDSLTRSHTSAERPATTIYASSTPRPPNLPGLRRQETSSTRSLPELPRSSKGNITSRLLIPTVVIPLAISRSKQSSKPASQSPSDLVSPRCPGDSNHNQRSYTSSRKGGLTPAPVSRSTVKGRLVPRVIIPRCETAEQYRLRRNTQSPNSLVPKIIRDSSSVVPSSPSSVSPSNPFISSDDMRTSLPPITSPAEVTFSLRPRKLSPSTSVLSKSCPVSASDLNLDSITSTRHAIPFTSRSKHPSDSPFREIPHGSDAQLASVSISRSNPNDRPANSLHTAQSSIFKNAAGNRKDIRSFFSSTTAPKFYKSCVRSMSPNGDTPLHSSFGEQVPYKSRPPQMCKKRAGFSQLTLDISNRPSTQMCKECGMSYVLGVDEDLQIHAKHHKRVVGGIEWTSDDVNDAMHRVVWRDEASFDHPAGNRIVKISLDPTWLKKTKFAKKVGQILEMVDISLGAQDLSSEQLTRSSMYLFLGENENEPPMTKKRKTDPPIKKKIVVKAVCIAARIEEAFKMVQPSQLDAADVEAPVGDGLIRFGEEATAVFCSPESQKALIGIHRIWTSPVARRSGLARRLADAVGQTFIYNLPIVDVADRQRLIAFSQPTESGMRFASSWLRSPCFNIFGG